MKAIDYETHLISDGAVFPKPVCLSAFDGSEAFLWNRADSAEFLEKSLNKELIIAHNAVFECGVTVTHYPDLADNVFDALDSGLIYCTKINESLWNIQREKPLRKLSLADLVLHYYNEDISATKGEDAWRLRYNELDGVPISEWPKEAIDYAKDDSIWAYKLYKTQKGINQLLALKSAVYLNLMGAQGFRIDKERVDLLEHEIWEFLTPRYDFLVNEGFCDYINNQKQPRKQMKKLREYIEQADIELQYTPKGGIATSSEALAFYMNQNEDAVLKAFSDLSKYEKILTSYIKNLKDNEKIYTSYSTTKRTGRTSSSSSKLFSSVNIQQMPGQVQDVTYDVRNCFIPREGFKICSIDYSALELCSAGHQLYTKLGYSYIRDMLNSGDTPIDPHSFLAARRMKIDYDEFVKNKEKYKEHRNKAKPLNLSFPGGVGYDTMRYLMLQGGVKTYFNILEKAPRKQDLYYYLTRLGCKDLRIKRLNKKEYALVQDELVVMKRDLFDTYPELEQFLKETHKKFLTGEVRYKKNDFGEWEEEPMYCYDVYGFKRDWCNYTALCNGFLMQTPSAIGAQKAVNKIQRTFHNSPDIFPQAFIHDEIVFEVRDGRYDLIDEAAHYMITEMQTILNTVRISAGASMSDYWQKADGFWTKKYWENAK